MGRQLRKHNKTSFCVHLSNFIHFNLAIEVINTYYGIFSCISSDLRVLNTYYGMYGMFSQHILHIILTQTKHQIYIMAALA